MHSLLVFSNRLDYCNSLLYGIGDGLLKKLQAVQNSAARVVTGTRKYDHITPVVRDLHWLPVRRRIDFKVAMTVLKCINDLAPQYLADDCVLASTVRSQRHLHHETADTMKLVVQQPKTVIGTRASFGSCGRLGLTASLRGHVNIVSLLTYLQSLLLLYGTDYQLTLEPQRERFRHLHKN